MSIKEDAHHQRLVDQFWHDYLSILEKLSIPAKARPCYRKHAQAYINAHEGVKLTHHQAAHIDDYLAAKGRITNLPEWQFRQTADALKLLFTQLVCPQWAEGYDWYQWRAFARTLEPDHVSLMRDGNALSLSPPSQLLLEVISPQSPA